MSTAKQLQTQALCGDRPATVCASPTGIYPIWISATGVPPTNSDTMHACTFSKSIGFFFRAESDEITSHSGASMFNYYKTQLCHERSSLKRRYMDMCKEIEEAAHLEQNSGIARASPSKKSRGTTEQAAAVDDVLLHIIKKPKQDRAPSTPPSNRESRKRDTRTQRRAEVRRAARGDKVEMASPPDTPTSKRTVTAKSVEGANHRGKTDWQLTSFLYGSPRQDAASSCSPPSQAVAGRVGRGDIPSGSLLCASRNLRVRRRSSHRRSGGDSVQQSSRSSARDNIGGNSGANTIVDYYGNNEGNSDVEDIRTVDGGDAREAIDRVISVDIPCDRSSNGEHFEDLCGGAGEEEKGIPDGIVFLGCQDSAPYGNHGGSCLDSKTGVPEVAGSSTICAEANTGVNDEAGAKNPTGGLTISDWNQTLMGGRETDCVSSVSINPAVESFHDTTDADTEALRDDYGHESHLQPRMPMGREEDAQLQALEFLLVKCLHERLNLRYQEVEESLRRCGSASRRLQLCVGDRLLKHCRNPSPQ